MEKQRLDDYFFEQSEKTHSTKRLVLVIYDITDNKRRKKFVEFLELFGVRVQKSAFEMIITSTQYEKLVKQVPLLIKNDDNIRIYKLKPEGQIVSWGSGMTQAEEVIII